MENSINNVNYIYFFLRPQRNCMMDSKSDNVEITMGSETDDLIKELFESFFKNYQKNLEEKNER